MTYAELKREWESDPLGNGPWELYLGNVLCATTLDAGRYQAEAEELVGAVQRLGEAVFKVRDRAAALETKARSNQMERDAALERSKWCENNLKNHLGALDERVAKARAEERERAADTIRTWEVDRAQFVLAGPGAMGGELMRIAAKVRAG